MIDDDGGVVKFNERLTCVSSIVNLLLYYTVDVVSISSKARKHMGALSFMWNYNNVPLNIKVKLHNEIPLNALSWGGNN